MTTHVLIVDEKTFRLHLEYLFVGTGATERAIDFNNCRQSSLHHSTEDVLVGMIGGIRKQQTYAQVTRANLVTTDLSCGGFE